MIPVWEVSPEEFANKILEFPRVVPDPPTQNLFIDFDFDDPVHALRAPTTRAGSRGVAMMIDPSASDAKHAAGILAWRGSLAGHS